MRSQSLSSDEIESCGGDGQGANAFAGCCRDGVANSSARRHRADFAHPAQLFAALNEVNLDLRRLPQMQGVEAVKIRLLGRTIFERDVRAQRRNPPHDSPCNV